MRTEYRNLVEKKVNKNQIGKMQYYSEVLIDEPSGLVKKTIDFKDKNIVHINYYIDEEETEIDVLNDLLNYSNGVSIIERDLLGEYTIEIEREYLGEELLSRSKYLIDEFGRIICHEDIDLDTLEPNYSETKKYYYLNSEVEKIYASYREDGSLKKIIYKPEGDENEQNWEEYNEVNFSDLQMKITDDISYYLNATFEL